MNNRKQICRGLMVDSNVSSDKEKPFNLAVKTIHITGYTMQKFRYLKV